MGRKGMRHAVSHRAGVKRDLIWKAMRIARTFTVADLEALTEATPGNIRSYIEPLAKAGYVECARPARCVPGDSYPKTWRLVRNTGPVAPRLALDGIFDANLTPTTGNTVGKRLAAHAPALVVQLRKLLEALETHAMKPELAAVALEAAQTLRRYDEDSR